MTAPAASPHPGYRPCVGVLLINRQGLVFVGRRAGRKAAGHVADAHDWQMPQGGVDRDEPPAKAALRELAEETSIVSVELLGESRVWRAYDLPPDTLRRSWRGKWLGQTQKWFALRFVGEEAEINVLSPRGGHKQEFDAWRWERPERLAGLIVPFKREVYEGAIEEFGPLLAP